MSADQEQIINPTNPKKLEQDYTYNPEDEINNNNNNNNDENNEKNNSSSLYPEQTKQLAQLKAFTIEFIDGTKKIYRRRKASLGEVGDYEEKKQYMFQFKGKPKEMNNAIVDFYAYAASVHLRETKNNGIMTKDEVKNTIFEEFKKVIDACEYAMLFNPN